MQQAWRAYLELALGLTEASRKRAQEVVERVVGRGGATAAQLQSLAEELVETSRANREALTGMVRAELERAPGRLGLASADEVAALTARVEMLERRLAAGDGGASAPAATRPAAKKTVAKKTVAKKAVAKKTVAKKAVAKKAPKKATGTPAGEARP